MKMILLIAFLMPHCWMASKPSLLTNTSTPKTAEQLQLDIRVSCELITWKSCEPNGISATVQVSIYINSPLNPTIYLLAAQQTVTIPCGTVHRMDRPSFDKNASLEGTDGVPLVTKYLNEKDEDGSIFKKISYSIFDVLRALDK